MINNKIIIVHVVFSLKCGGLEKMVIDLVSELNKRGYNNSICCLDNEGELLELTTERGIDVFFMNRQNGFDWKLIFKLAKILRKSNVDVVHTHNMGPLFYGSLAAKIANVPVIINTRHGREKKSLYSWVWNINNKVVVISDDAKREMHKYNHIKKSRSVVIYNGVDLNKYSFDNYKSNVRKELNLDEDTYIVGTVARLSEEKDQITLINTFYDVAKVISKVRLVLIGDGPLRNKLEEYAIGLNLRDKVLFLGFRKNIPMLLSGFDVFVLSSLTEGLSLTLLEAMAAKKPIVATNVGGNPEVVVEGITGFLVPPKDTDKMSEAIITLLKNSELRKKMGEAGRKRVEDKFSLDIMVSEYIKTYKLCFLEKGYRLLAEKMSGD